MTDTAHRSLPRLPSALVVSERTYKQLDRWAPVTIVRGPQGYGKTTLVASWLHDQPDTVRSLWVSARPCDQLGPFERRLSDQLRQAALLDAGEGHDQRDVVAVLKQMSRPPDVDRIVLVIDDAQWLDDEALLRGLVDVVAHHHQLHVIVCSRGRHPIETLVAGVVETVTVPARDLLLGEAEIRALADAMDVPISAEQSELLHSAIGGWVAAVRLVLEESGGPGQDLPLTRALDFLKDSVLPNIGDLEILGHVLRFALAERLTHRLIRDLADDLDPDTLVGMVEAPGLAERHYEPDDVVLVLPSFIHAGLREWVTARHPEQARETHRRLSRWFAAHDGRGHQLFALHHAVAGQDWEQADRVWTHHSTELVLDHPRLLAEELDKVPESVLATRPGMKVAREMARAGAVPDSDDDGRMVILRAYIDTSRRVASQGLDRLPLHDLYYVGTGYLVALRIDGRFAEADDVADQIERAAATLLAAGADPGDRMPWFHTQRGLTHTLRAEHPAAVHRYRLAWEQRRRTTGHVAANAAANLALTNALDGDLRGAASWLQRRSRIDSGRTWGSHLLDAGARVAAALLALDRLDTDACLAELNVLGDGTGPLELWPFVAYLNAQYRLHHGDPAAALGELDAAQRCHTAAVARGEAAVLLLTRARADLLLAEGKGQHAHAILAQHDAETEPMLAVPLARLHLLAGVPVEVRRIAANLLWKDSTDNRSRQELLLLKALASHRIGDLATSAEMTRRALALYEHTNLLLPFATLAAGDRQALFETAGQSLPDEDVARIGDHQSPFSRNVTLLQLTPRERLLAGALASTGSRREIAAELYVSLNTVRAQLATLYRKLGVRTRADALAELARLGVTGD